MIAFRKMNSCFILQEMGVSCSIYPAFEKRRTWETIKWLRSITHLPIVVKGVMTSEDAILAIQNGVSAIYVSNHGGRGLSSVQAPVRHIQEIMAVFQN